ncbi:MotA/TolQ/ExbB proton channel family protein [Flexibacterium corallicola]|uniref:MotA/TolQ/ExbB proton channel family protein n=1 Tax=Flexibacterium corallicola TaxID=3037259 RepID=UPI00286F0E6B|nr:MotA/TolQ/ExbB proton channel family protein [Pseudovibrio sp. M1P-2-3]
MISFTNFLSGFNSLAPLKSLLESGGSVVALLLGLSVIAVAIALSKFWQFYAMGVGRQKEAQVTLYLWQSGRKREACESAAEKGSILAVCLSHGMRGLMRENVDEKRVREDVERVCMAKLFELRSYLRGLDLISQIAPLLGLFGTVLGMIEAFQAMAAAGSQVDPSALAGGIWVALLTTAVGLAVAIPTTVILSIFEGKIEREQASMEELITALFTGSVTDLPNAHSLPLSVEDGFAGLGIVRDAS